MNASAKITSKGQITLPAGLRKELGLKPGDRVDFQKNESGSYELVAKTHTLADLRGIVKFGGPKPGVNDIVEAVKEARRERGHEIARRGTSGDGE